MKNTLFTIGLGFLASAGWAQQHQHVQPCITDELYFGEYLKQNPEAETRLNEAMEIWRNRANDASTSANNVIKIPVVFHIIHEYGDENISKAQILDQIRILNEDFRRTNADASQTRSIFRPVAADAQIEFVLATRDPNGRCHEGINRVFSNLTNNARDNVKALSYWNSARYLNVWVVKTIESSGTEGIVLGYAQFPWDRSSRPATDGIVLRADYVGSIGTSNTAKAGRVATHEVGHWLGLFHPFQGGCNPPSWGERLTDTPPVAEPSFGCNTNANTCTNDVPDLPDQIENFMDYANGNCQNMFTLQQSSLMSSMANTYRTQLISAANSNVTGIDNPNTSTCVPIADFSNFMQYACTGSEIEFEDLSYNASITTRNWSFVGGTPNTSNQVKPKIVYNTAGAFNVGLTVGNSNGNDNLSRANVVIIRPAIGNQKPPVSESFEGQFPASGWLLTSTTPTLAWVKSTPGFTGTSSVRLPITSTTPDGATAGFVTDAIDLGGLFDPRLSFRQAYAQRGTSAERLRVFVSTDCGQTWVLAYQRAGAQIQTSAATNANYIPAPDDWREHSINLNSYTGRRSLLVRFEVQTNGGNNFYIDDINITASVSVNPINQHLGNIQLYPNPASKHLYISADLIQPSPVKVEITDINGKALWVSDVEEAKDSKLLMNIPIQDFSNGVYLVNIHINGAVKTEKLIVNQ